MLPTGISARIAGREGESGAVLRFEVYRNLDAPDRSDYDALTTISTTHQLRAPP